MSIYVNPISTITPHTSSSVKESFGFSNTLNDKLKVPANLEPIFEEAAQTYQIPSILLKAVAKAESNFNTTATSRAGAQGVMQLMPATARSLGVGDSFDPRQNIMGGAKYLKQMLTKYDGNTKLALAAYNAGSGNVDKYNGIPPFKETQNYVAKVMSYAGTSFDTVPIKENQTYSSTSPTRSDFTYDNIMDDIFSFNEFSTDDYMLFLEIIKTNLKSPMSKNHESSSDQVYQSLLLSNRFQTLF